MTTGIDFDLELQALKPDGSLQPLNDSDVMYYGAILFQADGTEIARFSTNGDVLGSPWELSDKIESVDDDNGIFKVHVGREMTQGLISQDITARVMVQKDSSLDLDDHHTDNETWFAHESVVLTLEASLDDSVIDMS